MRVLFCRKRLPRSQGDFAAPGSGCWWCWWRAPTFCQGVVSRPSSPLSLVLKRARPTPHAPPPGGDTLTGWCPGLPRGPHFLHNIQSYLRRGSPLLHGFGPEPDGAVAESWGQNGAQAGRRNPQCNTAPLSPQVGTPTNGNFRSPLSMFPPWNAALPRLTHRISGHRSLPGWAWGVWGGTCAHQVLGLGARVWCCTWRWTQTLTVP